MKYPIAILGIIFFIAALGPNITDDLQKLADDDSLNVEDLNCDTLSNMIRGLELQNIFGTKSRVLRIRNSVELNRSENILRCRGTVLTSNGLQMEREFYFELDGFEYFYGVGN